MPEEQGDTASSCVGGLLYIVSLHSLVSNMLGTGGGEGRRTEVERHRRLVTITVNGRRPPRLDGAMSSSAKCIEAFSTGYGSY